MNNGILILALMVLAPPAFAGGDYEAAIIQQFDVHESTYTLVVTPVEKSKPEDYPPLNGCSSFTLIGKFDETQWKKQRKKGPARIDHMRALAAIKTSWESDKRINLGYMGRGFIQIKKDDACTVRSNGLQLLGKAIVSYGDGI